MKSQDLAKEIFLAASEIKAEEPLVLDLRQLTSFTDFFVILGGQSDRQVQAITDNIMQVLRKKRIKPLGIEGYETGHWILLDYGSVVAHVFYKDTRDFYALEKLWADAPRMEWDEKEVASK